MSRVVQINVNPQGGVPKLPVAEAMISREGVGGDKQNDRRFHGGPERAVSLYSYEHILELQDEGHPIDCGSTGENLTITGLDWPQLQTGDILQIGQDVCLELTSMAPPCKTITASFIDGEFKRIGHQQRPGWSRWYSRVLVTGMVHEGDSVLLKSH